MNQTMPQNVSPHQEGDRPRVTALHQVRGDQKEAGGPGEERRPEDGSSPGEGSNPGEGPPDGLLADIVLSVHNGAPYLAQQIRSLKEQTHQAWRLWIRDDGSTDGSLEVAEEEADSDARIHVHPPDGHCLGAARGFGWLLERLPTDACRIFCCDADDVWLPHKMELSLRALAQAEAEAEAESGAGAEAEGSGPVLLHTDMVPVDRELRPLHPSLWGLLGLVPEAATLESLAVANVVTGPTILMNRELLEEVIPVPEEAVHQDWWIALVAAVVGRTVGLPEATVLYRRHGSNTTHELPDLRRRPVADLVRRAAAAPSRTPALRAWILASSRQAGALLERFGHRLPPATARALEEMGTLHTCGFLERKGRLLRHYALPQRGLLRNLGLVLRG